MFFNSVNNVKLGKISDFALHFVCMCMEFFNSLRFVNPFNSGLAVPMAFFVKSLSVLVS